MIYPVFAEATPATPSAPAPAASSTPPAPTAPQPEQQQTVTIQQTAQPAPEGDQQKPGMKDGLLSMAPFIIIVVVMFYLMYRGQKKEQKRRQEMIDGTKKGDKVVTIGGIYGEIVEIHEDRFILKIADGVKIAVAKTAIAASPNKDEGEKAEKK